MRRKPRAIPRYVKLTDQNRKIAALAWKYGWYIGGITHWIRLVQLEKGARPGTMRVTQAIYFTFLDFKTGEMEKDLIDLQREWLESLYPSKEKVV